jgi:hypothetical protein
VSIGAAQRKMVDAILARDSSEALFVLDVRRRNPVTTSVVLEFVASVLSV